MGQLFCLNQFFFLFLSFVMKDMKKKICILLFIQSYKLDILYRYVQYSSTYIYIYIYLSHPPPPWIDN